MTTHRPCRTSLFSALTLALLFSANATVFAENVPPADAKPLRLLILGGENSHHDSELFARTLTPAFEKAGIGVVYTPDVSALARPDLSTFDAVLIYRDAGDLPADAEAGLLRFVEEGKGLVAVHCASHCFRNSERYGGLIGGRFSSHTDAVFRPRIIDRQHPAMAGLEGFSSWDETYLHDNLAQDLRVLMVRPESGGYEPWTWVRQQGKGRVFYTASGHDQRTWSQPGYAQLLVRGIQWAAGRFPEPPPLATITGKVPTYSAGYKNTSAEATLQAPLTPEESLARMHCPEGLRVELFAHEPTVVKPMAINFDHRGRAWVIESLDYPNNLLDDPHENGNDRIVILEDTTGDGRADKRTVFADRLNIPTSLVCVDGGAIVACAPHLLFLRDTDGDDIADERKILLTGFGRFDTHAVCSNLHYGLDNWIWGVVGYSGGAVTAGNGTVQFKQSILRFLRDGSRLEILTPTSNNTWGLGFTSADDVFASTANNQHSVHLAIPNRYFESVRGWHGVGSAGIEDHKRFHPITPDVRQVDWFGGFTAAAGHAVYTGGAFPPDYHDRAAFVCEPTGHLVHINWLNRRGSGFVARDGYNLLASTDAWTAPIAAEVGPDGAVWVLDWYNIIVQHNPTPLGFDNGAGNAYVTPLRDKLHGRIVRVAAETDSTPPPQLETDDTSTLLAALGHPNRFWRLTAQRMIVERGGSDLVPALWEKVAAAATDPAAAQHALMALAGLNGGRLDASDLPRLRKSLAADSPLVQRAALRVLPRTDSATQAILESGLLQHADMLLRKEALLALADQPTAAVAGKPIVGLLLDPSTPSDPWLSSAGTAAAAAHAVPFLLAASEQEGTSVPMEVTVAVVAEHWARGTDHGDLEKLLAGLRTAPDSLVAATTKGWMAGWPADAIAPLSPAAARQLEGLMDRLNVEGKMRLALLARRWKAGEQFEQALATLKQQSLEQFEDESAAEEVRVKAASSLIEWADDAATLERLVEAITPRASPQFVAELVDAMGKSQSDALGKIVLSRWRQTGVEGKRRMLSMLLRRATWTTDLLDAIDAGTIDATEFSVEQEQLLLRHPDSKLAKRAQGMLAQGGRVPDADRQRVLDALLSLTERSGDPLAGKLVFEKNCAKCHRFGPLGANVGPDLTGMGAHSKQEILTHILDPNRSVEGNFRQYTVVTVEGNILAGMIAAETRTAVELLDGEAKRHVILRDDIEEMASSGRSLMPEGFEKLPESELVDLLAFLTTRGRYFPLPLGKVATTVSNRGMFFDKQSEVERLVFPQWGAVTLFDIPFQLIDPGEGTIPNAILLHAPQGTYPPQMPRRVRIVCNGAVKHLHLLGGVSGWGYPLGEKGTVSMIVRLHYADQSSEDHELKNGEHLADYIRRVDVPGSEFAMMLGDRQIRYLRITPRRSLPITEVELIKGSDETAPVVMAITAESAESATNPAASAH